MPTSQTGQTDRQQSHSIGRNVLQTVTQKCTKHIKISPGYSWTILLCQNDRLDAPDRT